MDWIIRRSAEAAPFDALVFSNPNFIESSTMTICQGSWISLLVLALLASATYAQDAPDNPKDEGFEAPKTDVPALPKEFAFTFAMPYGIADEYPREPEEFERMLTLLKDAGFNTVYCPYTDWRHELFKKHGMKMMVDVLAWKEPVETDIRRNPEQRARVKEICEKSKDSDAIWGYNLWNERLDWCGDFKKLDLYLRMLRTWDPTHPVWVGTYRYLYCEHYPSDPGVVAWYDYPWSRGMAWNFKMLSFYRGISAKKHSAMGKWLAIDGYNEDLYSLNTSIAHGVKTIIWFIGGPYGAREPDISKRWDPDSHLIRLGRHMQPLYKLIGEMGPATAVYSTPTLRNPDNTDKESGLPNDTVAFPEDHWLQVKQGEVLAGFFDHPSKAEIVYVTNHNAFGWQGVVLSVKQDQNQPRIAYMFNREDGSWEELGHVDTIRFPLPPADAAVLRFIKVSKEEALDAEPVAESPPADWKPDVHFAEVSKLLEGELADNTKAPKRFAAQSAEDGAAAAPAIPADHWWKVKQGDVLCGVFPLSDGGEAVCFANLDGLDWQGCLVVPEQLKDQPTTIWQFDLETKKWNELGAWGDLNFPLAPAEFAVFKFKRAPK
jgi:hypothetical protein